MRVGGGTQELAADVVEIFDHSLARLGAVVVVAQVVVGADPGVVVAEYRDLGDAVEVLMAAPW